MSPLAPQRSFDSLEVGEEFPLPPRTVTEAHFSAFQALSGDHHPIHYDREYCLAQGHSDLLAHGFQVLCLTAAGAGLLPYVLGESMIGFLDQSCRFLKPVYPGDTLSPMLEITGLERQRSTGIVEVASRLANQRGELVLEGTQRYLVRLS